MNTSSNGALARSVLMVVMALPLWGTAQPTGREQGPDREALRQRMDRMFVAYLTEELDLSVEQGQRFWPLYNERKKGLDAAESELKERRRVLAETEWKAQSDFEKALDDLTLAETEMAELRAGFLKAIALEFDPEFAVRCMRARRSFESDMRERMSQRLEGPNRNPPGNRRPPGRQRR